LDSHNTGANTTAISKEKLSIPSLFDQNNAVRAGDIFVNHAVPLNLYPADIWHLYIFFFAFILISNSAFQEVRLRW
jgi:hypothetical protein